MDLSFQALSHLFQLLLLLTGQVSGGFPEPRGGPSSDDQYGDAGHLGLLCARGDGTARCVRRRSPPGWSTQDRRQRSRRGAGPNAANKLQLRPHDWHAFRFLCELRALYTKFCATSKFEHNLALLISFVISHFDIDFFTWRRILSARNLNFRNF